LAWPDRLGHNVHNAAPTPFADIFMNHLSQQLHSRLILIAGLVDELDVHTLTGPGSELVYAAFS